MLTGVEDPYNLEVTSRLARTKLAPLYFVRSGVVDPPGVSGGTFRYAGIYGYWWSSRKYSSSTHAYNLVITSGVNSSSEGVRYVGFSLRCLSTVLDM